MPEVDRAALLADVRKAYPGADKVPDDELLTALEKKYPQYAGKLTGGSTFDKMSVSDKAKQRLADPAAKARYEGAIKDADADIATSRAKVMKDVVLAGGAALAAPFTAGASLPAAAAIMAGTGATASLAAEGVKKVMGSRETAKSFGDLAWTVGFDAATFAGAEVGGRAIGAFAKNALPRMIMKEAAKVSSGKEALETMSERTLNGLEGRLQASVGAKGPLGRTTLDVDIQPVFKRAEARLAEIPRGKAEFGEQFADLGAESKEVSGKMQRGMKARADTPKLERQLKTATGRAEKAGAAVEDAELQTGPHFAAKKKAAEEADALVKSISEKLEKARGADSTKQPLDALITIKGDVQQFAYEHAKWREGKVFKKMAEELDQTIKANLKPGDERELYDHYNTIMKAQFDRKKVIEFTNGFMRFAARHAVGSAIGGTAGYELGGAKGAVAGAALGVLTPNASAFILKQTLKNPASRSMLKRAVNTWIEGSEGEARALAHRAFVTAGGRQLVKDIIDAQ